MTTKWTKQQRLDELGHTKFENLKNGLNGDDTDTILMDAQFMKCDHCKSWEQVHITMDESCCEKCDNKRNGIDNEPVQTLNGRVIKFDESGNEYFEDEELDEYEL